MTSKWNCGTFPAMMLKGTTLKSAINVDKDEAETSDTQLPSTLEWTQEELNDRRTNLHHAQLFGYNEDEVVNVEDATDDDKDESKVPDSYPPLRMESAISSEEEMNNENPTPDLSFPVYLCIWLNSEQRHC